jgi:hypothetical protein
MERPTIAASRAASATGGISAAELKGASVGVVSSVLEGCGEIADGEILFVVGSG